MRRLLAEHLGEFDQVFDAEDMQILGAAFDKAWEAVQASGVTYAEDKVEKPMLIGLAVHATMCGPDLVRALANAVFQALIHLKRPDLAEKPRGRGAQQQPCRPIG